MATHDEPKKPMAGLEPESFCSVIKSYATLATALYYSTIYFNLGKM